LLPNAALTLIESQPLPGGWVKSVQKGKGGEKILFECGPATLRGAPAGADTWEIVKTIGLRDEVLEPSAEGARNRYLFAEGQLQKIQPFRILRDCPDIMLEFAKPAGPEDESVGAFLRRRFGSSFAAKYGDAMVNGIYAGGLDQISVQSSSPFSKLKDMERKHGSVTWAAFRMLFRTLAERIRSRALDSTLSTPTVLASNNGDDGPPGYTYTFQNGMGSLPLRIKDYLEQHTSTQFLFNSSVNSIRYLPQDKQIVEVSYTLNGEKEISSLFDSVVCAIPARNLAPTLTVSGEETIQNLLGSMACGSCVIVSVGFKSKSMKRKETKSRLKGFGHLVPGKEGDAALGIIWHSSVFRERYGGSDPEQERFTVMMGGSRLNEVLMMSEEKLRLLARETIYKHLDILAPYDAEINVSKTIDSIAHYRIGHAQTILELRERIPECVQLAGASYDGVSVHDCVTSGKLAADRIATLFDCNPSNQ